MGTENKIIITREKLGGGAEANCYTRVNEDAPDTVIKVPNLLGRIWQTQGKEFINRCLGALDRLGIRRIQVDIHENAIVAVRGDIQEPPIITETPHMNGMSEATVKYRDLMDEEIGPRLIEELYELIEKANTLYREEKLGLDLYGGTIVIDVLRGLFQAIALKIAKIMPALEKRIPGVKGQMRNIIRDDEGLMLVDIGMHDLSEGGKFKFITRNLHHLLTASLIEILRLANSKMPAGRKLAEEEFDILPYNGEEWHKGLSRWLANIMIPLFERYDKREAQANTPPPPLQVSAVDLIV